MDWQPIETAPRQTHIFIFTPGVGVDKASFCLKVTNRFSKWGWFVTGLRTMGNSTLHPTHWMPIPQPPTESK